MSEQEYGKTMEDVYREELVQAIDYAIETGSFNKKKWVNSFENVCVFGLGKYFDEAFIQQNVQERYHVNFLSDNTPDKLKNSYCVPCISVEKLRNLHNVVVIIMVGNSEYLCKQLDEWGIPWVLYQELAVDAFLEIPENTKWFTDNSDKILEVYDLLDDKKSKQVYATVLSNRIAHPVAKRWYREVVSDDEYFYTDCFQLSDNEIYVDCGAYDGDTIRRFMQAVGHKYSHIYAYELDKELYENLEKNVRNIKNVTCINAGVWDCSGKINYGKGTQNDPAEGISVYKKNNVVEGDVVDLDTSLLGKRVTLIKMDIEGAEQKALKGAEKTIKNHAPKLAICLYHRLDDLWEIPLYIKKLNPKYKIFIKHHFPFSEWTTVMYASVFL